MSSIQADSVMSTASEQHSYRIAARISRPAADLPGVMSAVRRWVEEQVPQSAVDFANSGRYDFGEVSLRISSRDELGGSSLRVELIRVSNQGTWRIEFALLHPRRGECWWLIAGSNSEGRNVDPPRLFRYIADIADCADGPMPIRATPEVINSRRVDDLIHWLTSEDRSMPILLAGTPNDPDWPLEKWKERFSAWARQATGMAHALVLDSAATLRFAEIAGLTHAVAPGTIRTFQREVQFNSAQDGARHRFIGTRRLITAGDAELRRLLSQATRRLTLDSPLPSDAARSLRQLRRASDNLILAKISTPVQASTVQTPLVTPPTQSQRPAAPELLTESIAKILGIPEVSDHALRGLASKLRQQEELIERYRVRDAYIETLRIQYQEKSSDIERLSNALEESHLELRSLRESNGFLTSLETETRHKLNDETRRANYFEKQAQKASGFQPFLVDEPLFDRAPVNMYDLLDYRSRLESAGIICTFDEDPALDLEEFNDTSIVDTACQVFRVLASYKQFKTEGLFEGGLDIFISNPPSGAETLLPNWWKPTENSKTMDDYGDERIFKVPLNVSSSGYATMKAHFVLGSRHNKGSKWPRMHILDETSRHGIVIVGYIGRHLNTATGY